LAPGVDPNAGSGRGPTTRSTRALLAGGVIGPLVFIGVFLVEGALRPDYDPLRHQVSLLSLGDRGPIQVASFLVSGAAVVAFAIGLARILAPGRAARGGPFGIALAGAGLVVAGLFSVQPSFGYPPGAPAGIANPSAASYVHVAGAFMLFAGLFAAAALFAARFRGSGRAGWASYSALSAVLVLVFFMTSSGASDGQPFVPAYAGLLQRIALISGLVWVAALAAGIIRGVIESPPAAATLL
jgi:hypothetical protein